MTTARTAEQKTSDWFRVFEAVKAELTPEPLRKFIGAIDHAADVATLRSYQELARIVAANDRAAALVAGMLTANGVKPVPIDLDMEDDDR